MKRGSLSIFSSHSSLCSSYSRTLIPYSTQQLVLLSHHKSFHTSSVFQQDKQQEQDAPPPHPNDIVPEHVRAEGNYVAGVHPEIKKIIARHIFIDGDHPVRKNFTPHPYNIDEKNDPVTNLDLRTLIKQAWKEGSINPAEDLVDPHQRNYEAIVPEGCREDDPRRVPIEVELARKDIKP